MLLVKSIIPKKIKTLYCFRLAIVVLLTTAFSPAFSQDNSPYSRYGLGDLIPPGNIVNRGMGGLSAGYTDFLSVNFSNPASYSSFIAGYQAKSKKVSSGRAILDLGINIDNRSLKDNSVAGKFTASNAVFSYVQVGLPIRRNWGMSFGLRPISRISYKLFRNERLFDPITGDPIDSASTRFEGDGGAYLASLGTGFSLFHRQKKGMDEKLSIGINGGYLFGRKDHSTKRSLINDTVAYYQANYETRTNYGSLYASVGFQYQVPLSEANKIMLTIGAYGNWSQHLNARQDVLRETFIYDDNLGDVRLDSVSDTKDVKGKIILPASYTAGFVLQKFSVPSKEGGWLIGVDFEQENWSQYRIYGQSDSVQNRWQVRVGAQLSPVPKRNYWSNVVYRFGFYTGPDYIKVGQKLNQIGATIGMGLPISGRGQAVSQFSLINLAFEYSKRGNNSNLLRENMFRFSIGFSLSDIWFVKRKYD